MESLPTELLISIGECVSYKAGQHVETLCSLAQCSRRFHAIYQPLIYRHISPTSYWSIHTIHLIQRMWRDPDLAAQVRHLDFGSMIEGDVLQEYSDIFDVTSATSFIDAALEEIFEPGEMRSKLMWRYRLLRPSKEAWLSLLLVRLTHLQSIKFAHPWSVLLTELLCKAARRQRPFHRNTPFPCLETVKADVIRDDHRSINADIDSLFLMPFFFFPAVRKIIGRPVPDYWYISQGELPFVDVRTYDDLLSFNVNHSSRPVREITITGAWWGHGMVEWLAACKNLEHLRIQFFFAGDAWHYSDDVDDAKLNSRKFRRALLPFVGTLKTLDIEVTTQLDDDLYTIMDDAGTFGSLKEFTVLEKLRITPYLLARISTVDSAPFMMRNWLADRFPSSLKDLEILAVTADLYHGLIFEVMLLIADRASMPQLERVRVQLTLHPDGEHQNLLIPWCIDISVERLVPMGSDDDAREQINTAVKVEMTSKLPAALRSSNPDEISSAKELVHVIRMLLNKAGLKDNGVCHFHKWKELHEMESETPSPRTPPFY
ncbi:unnamed protein product [Penicillium salamii]|nr:unnamed protein product [Penicillium salamii]CAG8180503.1 unnamed protein product [Penicillium salamii]CAG8371695.1 unnamed protein product [Penicillium salamii]